MKNCPFNLNSNFNINFNKLHFYRKLPSKLEYKLHLYGKFHFLIRIFEVKNSFLWKIAILTVIKMFTIEKLLF
jgi:hypothetical protein